MRLLPRLLLAFALLGGPLAGYAHGLAHALHDIVAAAPADGSSGACDPLGHAHRDGACAQCVAYAGFAFAAAPAGGVPAVDAAAAGAVVARAWSFVPAPEVPFVSRGPPRR